MKNLTIFLTAAFIFQLGCTFVAADDAPPFGNYKPRTPREKELFQLMLELNKELTALRREVKEAQGGQSQPKIDIDVSKYRKMFATYDKNGDGGISLQERLAMRNYEVNGARLLNEKLYHLADDLNRDGGVSVEEFALSRERKQTGSWVSTKLLKVNASESQITVESRGGERTNSSETRVLQVAAKAVISLKGHEVKLADLVAGQPIFVFMSHDKQVAIGLTQR